MGSNDWLAVLTLLAAMGSGLIAGVFFAFSAFVMRALGRLSAPNGIAAMQSINIVVINPLFMMAFFGTAVACIAIAVWALISPSPAKWYLISGSLLYLFGTIFVTMACNVPRNNALAAVDPASPAGSDLWANYLVDWTAWNHVRTAAALAASACLVVALIVNA